MGSGAFDLVWPTAIVYEALTFIKSGFNLRIALSVSQVNLFKLKKEKMVKAQVTLSTCNCLLKILKFHSVLKLLKRTSVYFRLKTEILEDMIDMFTCKMERFI